MQHPYHKGPALFSNEAHNFMMLGSRSFGKALRDDTLIPLANGSFKAISKLVVGDMIFSKDGKPTKVTGVYPQGVVDLYKITLRDGRELVACKDHLHEIIKWGKKKILTTEQLYEQYLTPKRKEHILYLETSSPVELPINDNLLIDPYTLGALIGDGSLTAAISIHTTDSEILNNIPYEKSSRKAKNEYGILGIKSIIESLKLNCKSEHKFIPKEYLNSSIDQRIALLQGLMDTNGYISKTGNIEYSTSSSKLAEDILKLARSLGIVAIKKKRKTKKLDSYRIYMFSKINPFRLTRKRERFIFKPSSNKVSI